MSIIPDPVEAAQLRALYAGNPIVDLAERALRAFGIEDASDAMAIFPMWRHIDGLSARECRAVIARFVPPAAPLVAEVAKALYVLGCITRGNAAALLDLTVVRLTDQEREQVLSQFTPGGDE